MKIAVVFDAPKAIGVHNGVAGTYLDRTIEAVGSALDYPAVEFRDFFAVSEVQPGGRVPPIADVRKERDRLIDELEAWQPDRILSVGAAALNALDGGDRILTISKQRGRMRMLGDVPWLPTINHGAVIRAADLHRDFANDVYKILTQAAPVPPMNITLLMADDFDAVREGVAYALEGASVVAVDLETTGLSPYRDLPLAVGFGAVATDGTGVAVVVPREALKIDGVALALDANMWSRERRTVGHNFKFDMQFLAKIVGSWLPDDALVGDTLLLSHLIDERPNRPDSRVRGLGLKEIVATRYDFEYGFDFNDSTLTDADLYEYLAKDVCYTARLWLDLAEEEPDMVAVHDRLLMPISRGIARCELQGAPVDLAWVQETIVAFERRIARRQAAVEKAIVKLAPTMVIDNVLSPQQVADVMYDEWGMTPDVRKHGKLIIDDRSTDKDHVKSAVSKYLGTALDRQAKWLRSLERLRRDVRTRTTYQKSLMDRVDDDWRVRASFLIHGTSTGRLSSQGPNLQNVPSVDREDSSLFRPMRRAFRPREGYVWAEADYSQLELRVAAALSQDPDFMEVFRSGRDVHLEVASAIFNREPERISKAERFLAKAVAFGIIYGRGAKALTSGAEMRYVEQRLGGTAWTEEQADAFIRRFLASYPRLAQWMEQTQEQTLARGYVETPFGRRRRFPLMPSSRGETGAIRRQAVNTPIQSAASDICLEAMIAIQDATDGMDVRVLFPVHDSICLEIGDDSVKLIREICELMMEKDFMGVPLTIDFEYGPTWADVRKEE